MEMVTSQEDFKKKKYTDLVEFKCKECLHSFFLAKRFVCSNIIKMNKNPNLQLGNFCSKTCKGNNSRKLYRKRVTCLHCKKEFEKKLSHIASRPNHFCSPKCFHNASVTAKIIPCTHCGSEMITLPNQTIRATNRFCSQRCSYDYKIKTKNKTVICLQCNKQFTKILSRIKDNVNHFCTQSCAATYNNTHKTYGSQRSKLEVYIEKELRVLYPDLEFHFNRKDTINSELDIYIPSLKLAFELNGPFHYEPIFGEQQLQKVQNNDARKFQACLEKGIEFCIIDSSKQKYFKESTSQPFLDIIKNILNKKLLRDSESP